MKFNVVEGSSVGGENIWFAVNYGKVQQLNLPPTPQQWIMEEWVLGFSSPVCVSSLDENGILIWQWRSVEILSLCLLIPWKPKRMDPSAPSNHPSLFCNQLGRLSLHQPGGVLSCPSSVRATYLFHLRHNDFSLSCAAVPASVSGQLKRKCLHPADITLLSPRISSTFFVWRPAQLFSFLKMQWSSCHLAHSLHWGSCWWSCLKRHTSCQWLSLSVTWPPG